MLHHWSTRRQGQFVALNCAGLPETLLLQPKAKYLVMRRAHLPVRLKSVLEKLNMQMVVRYF